MIDKQTGPMLLVSCAIGLAIYAALYFVVF